jgi:hypothetical protein
MKAIHGGQAKQDNIDAQKIAVLLRGGMLPQASVYPAKMRATRDLLRRCRHLTRQRAETLVPSQHTNHQDIYRRLAKSWLIRRTELASRSGVPILPCTRVLR